jgi:hypothetical protein
MAKDENAVRIKAPIARQTVNRLARLRSTMNRNCLRGCEPGWNVATFDANRLLAAVRHVRLKPGLALAAYQFCDGHNGNGRVVVIPTRRALPAPDFFDDDSNGTGKLPEWMSTDVARHLDGDGTPESYFEVSVLLRELGELGAAWHGCSWSAYRVLLSPSDLPHSDLPWREPQPADWRPTFSRAGSVVTVTFWAYTRLGQEQVVRFEDRYAAGYAFDTTTTVAAEGAGGYIP